MNTKIINVSLDEIAVSLILESLNEKHINVIEKLKGEVGDVEKGILEFQRDKALETIKKIENDTGY